jgi:hypothetical protein
VPFGGSGYRREPFESVADQLEVNVLRLEAPASEIVLVSFDLMFVGLDLEHAVRAHVQGRVSPEQLLLAASHTHFAPAVDMSKPGFTPVDETYLAWVQSQAIEAIDAVFAQELEPVCPVFLQTTVDHAINRRRRRPLKRDRGRYRVRFGAMGLGPNPQGPRDETVRMLRLDTAEGRPLAVLWGYSCHPTRFPAKRSVSAEYPGVVRAALREEHSAELPVGFLQGFAGDISQPARMRGRGPKSWLRRLVHGPTFDFFTPEAWRTWSGSLADRVVTLSRQAGTPIGSDIAAGRARRHLSDFMEGAPERDVTFQVVRLGDAVVLAGVSAEPVTALRGCVKGALGDDVHVWPIGYIDDVFGYLPTARMLGEGGYEVKDFKLAFGLSGDFRPDPETPLANGIRAADPANAFQDRIQSKQVS